MRRIKILKSSMYVGLVCLGLSSCITNVFAITAVSSVSIGRYLAVANKPQQSQQDLLQQQIQIHFPQSIFTIGQAMQFVLQFSGYHLVDAASMQKAASTMLKSPLPEVDRDFGPMPLQTALATLAGQSFYLLVDPVHRLISFKLKPAYKALY